MTAKYNFDSNLLQLSMSEDIELAKKEWILVYNEKLQTKTGICICQHTIKNVVYCYNKYTKRYISVGLVCCKKFQLKLKKSSNKLLVKVFDEIFEKGGYSNITDIFDYSDKVECQLKTMVQKMYEHITDIGELHLLLAQITNLIDEYKFEYMQSSYDVISEKIRSLTEEQKPKEKLEIVKKYEEEQARLLLEQKKGCSDCAEAKKKGRKQCYICSIKGNTDCKKCIEAQEGKNGKRYALCFKCNQKKKEAQSCEHCNGTGEAYYCDDTYGECLFC